MENQKNKLTEEVKLMEEKKRLMEAVNSDPHVANSPLPPNMLDKVYKEIRANEAERAIRAIDAELMKAGVPLEEDVDEEEEEIGASEAKTDAGREFSEEDKELIRLGKIYRKRKKLHRYLVAAAAIVGVLAFGITSMGGPKKVFEKFERNVLGREQSGIDIDDNTKFVETIDEEEVYQEIEDKYGFLAVRPVYLPEDVVLLETSMGDEIQGIHLTYGTAPEANISYHIRPNYRESSWGKDIEDELLKEEHMTVSDVDICLKQYQVDEATERWQVGFEHNNVSYSMLIMNLEEPEIEKIVENLIIS
ncbi:MAG: DUF4367 domain-containing protein [Tyzzerella sp.]|nr:DUF4367 domain-containing protein [Tyzzerella sp.]